jgi:hypothetical protein
MSRYPGMSCMYAAPAKPGQAFFIGQMQMSACQTHFLSYAVLLAQLKPQIVSGK